MQFGTEFFRYQFLVTNKTVLYFRAALSYRFLVPLFGTDFWYVCHWHYTYDICSLPEIGAENRYHTTTCLTALDVKKVFITATE